MAKFDLERYWDFRVWVKSQIAQLRALLSEYQQNGGGGGTGGDGDFDPNGSYPNMSVGTATKATSATTADRATKAATASLATRATVADSADSATHADSADSATIANSAMKAEYATNAGNAERAKIANSAESAKSAASASTATLAINLQNAPELTTSNEQIVVKVGNKTSNALTVPYAQRADFATDLSGRVEATPEVFTYRPSAGDKSIKDDNAFIRRVKGNSVVFNQIGNPLSANGGWYLNPVYGTVEYGDNYIKITSVSDSQAVNGMGLSCVQPLAQAINGHAYLMTVDMKPSKAMQCVFRNFADTWTGNKYDLIGGQWSNISYIVTCTSETTRYPYIGNSLGSQIVSGDTIEIKNLMIIDLTAMFGTGNEPTTVEEFRALYPNSYYPYNAGELRNLVCSGIKTVGFNQWDEQWEVGGLGTDEYGSPIAFDDMIRSTNYNPIFPSTEYYIRTSNAATYIWYYDSDKKYIGRDIKPNSRFFITPTNAAYFKLRIGDTTNTITTYNHDICINLHHTGYRDGEYEPYKEVTHSLPLNKITNGEPLRKAGSVYDEINETEYIKRVGVVDLGSYDWYETPNGTFNTIVNIPDIKAAELEPNYTCEKYIGVGNPSTIYAGTADNLTISTNSNGRIYIRDDAYKTGTAYAAVPALKASLSGVLLHYELAEPIVKPIETPIDFNYYVEDFGTEEAILAENSAPFSADIIYQFNATDQVRNNTRNIQRLKKTAFNPSGSTKQYIRGDGSYGDVSELSRVIPIYDGEMDSPDDSYYNYEFRLFPQQYAKLKVVLDSDYTILVRIEAPENSDIVAEYWLEIDVDISRPTIEFVNSENDNIEDNCRFNGEVQINAKNIWHIITTDGGTKFMGEIKNYVF